MKYKEYGEENKEVIMLLHGGGLSVWNYQEEAEALKNQFHIILPILDGHNGSNKDFTSIEDNASALIKFIDDNFNGKVLLIGGLSLGGQVLVEMLSQRNDICEYAIIESALVLPMKTTAMLIKPTFSMCYSLVKKQWFAKIQFKSLHIKSSYFDKYYRDSASITKENMIAFLMANSDYKIKSELENCKAKALVIVGSKEQRIMKKSAQIICQQIKNSSMEIMQGYYHGDLSLNHSDNYIKKIIEVVNNHK